MKKFFFFAAALVAAATINAETYDFGTMSIAEGDLTVVNGTVTNNAEKGYFEVKNNAGEIVELSLKQVPNVKFTYKNSAVKTAFKVSPEKYIQFDGDQRDITFTGLAVGTEITMSVASKGTTANSFEDSDSKGKALTGCVWVSGNKTLAPKGDALVFEEIKVQAAASTVTIRTTAGGYCLNKLTIGGTTAIDNTAVEAKATKYMENGALVIVKNGVKYNALGAVIE